MKEPELTHNEVTRQALDLARAGGDGPAQARKLLEDQLRADPESFPPLDAEVEVLQSMHEPELAARLLEEYIRFYPENTNASARLAWLRWEEGSREEALAEIKAAVARDGTNTRARWWLLKWLDAVGDFTSLKKFAQEGVQRDPDNGYFILMVARAAAHLKEEDLARSSFVEALRIDPTSEEVLTSHADFLITIGKTKEAAELLAPHLTDDASARLRSRAITVFFRMSRNDDALNQFLRIITGPSQRNTAAIPDAFRALFLSMPPDQSDALLFSTLERGQLNDASATEFWTHLNARSATQQLQRLFDYIAPHSLQYPQTMMQFLTQATHHRALASGIMTWIKSHRPEIEANTKLWGSVGVFFVTRKRWPDASLHLEHYEGRPGLKPWMILLYVRALEAVGRINDANHHCRRALQLDPDKAEAGIRSRLAFNLALDHLASTAKVIILDLSQKGKDAAVAADIVRMIAVESLAGAAKVNTFALRKELFDEAMRYAKEVAKQDTTGDAEEVIARFRRRLVEILASTRL
ncbi:hypothetical protein IT570_04900 [Candidatus Sumerlaeota bacterium]|nr:hypothetical protein [Candidatus Sumerlaeota bacterium]